MCSDLCMFVLFLSIIATSRAPEMLQSSALSRGIGQLRLTAYTLVLHHVSHFILLRHIFTCFPSSGFHWVPITSLEMGCSGSLYIQFHLRVFHLNLRYLATWTIHSQLKNLQLWLTDCGLCLISKEGFLIYSFKVRLIRNISRVRNLLLQLIHLVLSGLDMEANFVPKVECDFEINTYLS